MYAIRLELGRELEDVLFQRMQAKKDAEEREAAKYRAKRAWYIRKFGTLFLHIVLMAAILIFTVADISKYNDLRGVLLCTQPIR